MDGAADGGARHEERAASKSPREGGPKATGRGGGGPRTVGNK